MRTEDVSDLISQLRDPCPHENCIVCYNAADTLEEYGKEIQQLRKERAALEAEVQTYRDAARLYGIDARTMLTLAKSQIKTCADNIRIAEKMQGILSIFDVVPDDLTARESPALLSAGGIHYGKVVNCALVVLEKYLKVREGLNEWRKSNL